MDNFDSFRKKYTGLKSIEDINKQFDYKDEHPQGKGDKKKVACGQCGDYNELQEIYDEKLAEHVDAGKISESDALYALSYACHKLPNPRDRKEYYKLLGSALKIKVD